MPITYRIYTIGRGGHFLGAAEVVECADDKEVVDKAMQATDSLDVEIWDHKRFVASVGGTRESGRLPSWATCFPE
jgi:hypothetical protein